MFCKQSNAFKRFNYRRYAHRTPYKREKNVNNEVTMSPIVSTGVLKNFTKFLQLLCYIVIPFETELNDFTDLIR